MAAAVMAAARYAPHQGPFDHAAYTIAISTLMWLRVWTPAAATLPRYF